MPQSFAQLLVHIIFSTKDRVPLISPDVRPRLYPYLGATLQACGCEPVQIGGTEDHVHIACVLSKNHAPSQVIEDIKKNSSKWIKGIDPAIRGVLLAAGVRHVRGEPFAPGCAEGVHRAPGGASQEGVVPGGTAADSEEVRREVR